MKNFKFIGTFLIVLFALLLAPSLMAQTETNPADGSISNIIVWCTPFVVFGATELVKMVRTRIPGWVIISVVPMLSGVVVYFTNLIGNPDYAWWIQLGLGLLAVFVHQVYKQLLPPEKKVN